MKIHSRDSTLLQNWKYDLLQSRIMIIRHDSFLITIKLIKNSLTISSILNCVIFIGRFNNLTLPFFDIKPVGRINTMVTHSTQRMRCIYPAGIWCQNDVVSTSMRRNYVASTLIRRHFRTKCPLGRVVCECLCRWSGLSNTVELFYMVS